MSAYWESIRVLAVDEQGRLVEFLAYGAADFDAGDLPAGSSAAAPAWARRWRPLAWLGWLPRRRWRPGEVYRLPSWRAALARWRPLARPASWLGALLAALTGDRLRRQRAAGTGGTETC